jgi:hypothetical protein
MSDLAALITALAALVTASGLFVSAVLNSRSIKAVHREVTTGNSQTLAQLADASESRRVGNIDEKNRTELEKSHLAEAGSAYTRAAPKLR